MLASIISVWFSFLLLVMPSWVALVEGRTALFREGSFPETQQFESLRQLMVEQQIKERGIRDQVLLQAMAAVPRHRFVPPELVHLAYADLPLPIGYDQTISQPYIVAYMSAAEVALLLHRTTTNKGTPASKTPTPAIAPNLTLTRLDHSRKRQVIHKSKGEGKGIRNGEKARKN